MARSENLAKLGPLNPRTHGGAREWMLHFWVSSCSLD